MHPKQILRHVHFWGEGVSAYRFDENIQYPVTISLASCGEIFNFRELARTVRLLPTEYTKKEVPRRYTGINQCKCFQ